MLGNPYEDNQQRRLSLFSVFGGDIILLPYPYTDPSEGVWLPISEIFFPKIIPGIYLISNYGIVCDLELNSYLPRNIYYEKDKYITISLRTIDGSSCFAQPHRLVGYHFLYQPGCEILQINHKDNIKYHNWSWNLEWMTPWENTHYAMEHGNFKFGQDRKLTKLTNEQALDICNMLESGMTPREISKSYKIDNVNVEKTAFNIRNGHCWDHLSKNFSFRKHT